MERVQKKIGLNLVNNDGAGHMVSGLYLQDGVITSECFGCGLLSDRCVCEIFDNNFIPDQLPDFVNASYQICYQMPKIKGISSPNDYVVLFLDKKYEEEGKDVYLSNTIHCTSETDEGAQSWQISGVQVIQAQTKTPELSKLEIFERRGRRPSNELSNLCSTGERQGTDSSVSSCLGFGPYQAVTNYGEEKSGIQCSNQIESQTSRDRSASREGQSGKKTKKKKAKTAKPDKEEKKKQSWIHSKS